MTSFIDDDGNELDYNGKDFGLTKRNILFTEFKLQGNFSQNIKFPNTAKNREILNIQGVRQIGSGMLTRQSFSIFRDGNLFSRGHLVINIFEPEGELEGFFISGNADWFNALSFKLRDIEMNEDAVIMDRFEANKDKTMGIVYPMIDVAFNGSKVTTNFETFIWPSPGRPNGGTNLSEYMTEAIPCYYMHSLLKYVSQASNIKITGDILTDKLFQAMVVTPESMQLTWPDKQINESYAFTTVSGASALDPGIYTQIMFDTVIDSGTLRTFNTTAYSWTAPYKCSVDVDLNLFFTTSEAFTGAVYKNGVLYVLNTLNTANNRFRRTLFVDNCNRGDVLTIYVRNAGAVSDYRAECTALFKIRKDIYSLPRPTFFIQQKSLVPPQAIVPDITALEFIKSLCCLFNMIPFFDEASQTLTLNKLSGFKREDAVDWSEYYISHREDYKAVAQNNYFKWKEVDDFNIKQYNKTAKEGYGGANIQTPFTAKKENTIYTLPYGAVVDRLNETNNNWPLPYIPFYTLEDDVEYEYSSVVNIGGSRFDGTGWATTPNTLVRIYDDNNLYSGYSNVSLTPTTGTMQITFAGTSSGSIFTQKILQNTPGHRLLIVKTATPLTDVGVNAGTIDGSAISTMAFAWFDKDKMNRPVDEYKTSLALGTVGNKGYNQTLFDLYWDKVDRLFNSPVLPTKLLMPISEFEKFNGNKLVYLKTRKLSGYFICAEISGYRSGNEEVEVDLYAI